MTGPGAGLVGVVLGAGESRRLGRPKQTLPFGGRTLLAHVVAQVEASTLERVVVVLGGEIGEGDVGLAGTRAEVVRNDGYGTGCASSLLAGLDAAGACDAIAMLLGDMPGVDADLIDAVTSAWRSQPSWAAVTDYQGALGHPFVFSADAFDTLRRLHGDKAVWQIVDREPPSRVARIAVPRPLPADVDTWEDYEAVHAAHGFPPAERPAPGAPADPGDEE